MEFNLKPKEIEFFKKLDSPWKVQDFLDKLGYNYCEEKYICHCPRNMIDVFELDEKAHCLDSAIFAAAAMMINGKTPLMMEFLDDDKNCHFITPFKHGKFWGAMAHSRTYTLRWRDPLYETPKELARSYFLGFVTEGKLTLKTYTDPTDLRIFKDLDWMNSDRDAEILGDRFDSLKQNRFFNSKIELRPVPLELEDVYNKFKE